MKKFSPIITGVLTGVAISALLITFNFKKVVFGEESGSWWNDMMASQDQDWFDWEDVFNPFGPSEKGKNLYNLIYKKLNRTAEKTALKEISQKYGLTTDETEAVVNGSVSALFNNAHGKGKNLTQQDAYVIVNKLQEDFKDIKELYQIQQEVDVAIAPGEIFANGDLSDSGFDLIVDLSKIEEILFVNKTPTTIGGKFKNAYKSPYKPTEADATIDNYYVTSDTATATLELSAEESAYGEFLEDEEEGGVNENFIAEGVVFDEESTSGLINIGEEQKKVEILDKDICLTDDSFEEALKNVEDQGYPDSNGDQWSEEEPEAAENGEGGEEFPEAGGDSGDQEKDGSDDEGFGDDEDDGKEQSDDEVVEAAKTDNWNKVWCPGGDDEVSTFAGLGTAGFETLTGAGQLFAGGAAIGSPGVISAKIALCFDAKVIKKQVSSFQPGDSCILCEVEKINESMDKTLSHTLIPNKATGNLLESAKCKNSGTLLFLQFVTIWNPVPTPENDEIIFGRNIFEEWNKFAKRYQPLLLYKEDTTAKTEERPEQSEEYILELEKMSAPADISQSQLIDSIRKTKAKYKAEATFDVENVETTSDAANIMVYSKNVLDEMKQMNSLFANFKEMFNKMDKEALEKIVTKKNID